MSAQYPTPTTSIGPDVSARDGNGGEWDGGALMRTWVHPNVVRVPEGSWMRFKDEAERDAGIGTVTHVWIDTPYPQSANEYETPYLLYSADNDLSERHEWPGVTNPIEAYSANNSWLSDPALAIRSDGSLYACWRFVGMNYAADRPEGKFLEYRIITGTCLADVTVGPMVRLGYGESGMPGGFSPAEEYGNWVAPSILDDDPSLWHLYIVQRFENLRSATPNRTGPVQRWTSTDEGASYEFAGYAIIPELVDGVMERLWHGSVSGPFDGWYYAVYSASENGLAYAQPSDFRVFRSQSPVGPWERSDRMMWAAGTAGSIANYTCYQGVIVDRDGGSLVMVGSGNQDATTSDTSDGYRVGQTATVEPSATFDAEPGDPGEPPTGPLDFVLEPYVASDTGPLNFVLVAEEEPGEPGEPGEPEPLGPRYYKVVAKNPAGQSVSNEIGLGV